MKPRPDDFSQRREGIANLSDEELHDLFWQLAFSIVEPLIDLAKKHTSPSIERSVLLRMGVSSLDSQTIVKGCMERGILGKGAGHVVWRVARDKGIDIKAAAEGLASGKYWDYVEAVFGPGATIEAAEHHAKEAGGESRGTGG